MCWNGISTVEKIRAGKVGGKHLWEGIEFDLGLLGKASMAR